MPDATLRDGQTIAARSRNHRTHTSWIRRLAETEGHAVLITSAIEIYGPKLAELHVRRRYAFQGSGVGRQLVNACRTSPGTQRGKYSPSAHQKDSCRAVV